MKRFSDRPDTSKRVQFEVDFWNGSRSETHQFNAYPALDAFAIATINKLAANERTGVESLIKVKDNIRSLLDDNDGTPLDWEPTVLPREAHVTTAELAVWPAVTDEYLPEESGFSSRHTIVGGLDDEDEVPEAQFLAPDGTVHPLRDADKFLAVEAGSSRRRWVELMDGDNDLIVEAKTIMKLWQWLVKESADRPTVR
jgi:hypothetical protein